MNWPENYKTLLAWWQTPQGQTYLEFEKAVLKQRLANVFGYQIVVIGDAEFSDYAMASRVLNYIRLNPLEEQPTKLPRDIDVLVLPHWLYYFPHCQPLLTALNQSMTNGGLMLITGYNYASILGWQRFRRYKNSMLVTKPARQTAHLKKLLLTEQFMVHNVRKYGSFDQQVAADLKSESIKSDQIKPTWCGWLSMIEATKNIAMVKTVKPIWAAKTKALPRPATSPFIASNSHEC
jgi:hypothetical protein